MTIKNIIFDLGGVILNIDFKKMHQAFAEIGIKDISLIYEQTKQTKLIDHFELGKISANEFREGILKLINLPITNQAFDNAWNAMLLDLPEERLQFIQRLRKQYQLNTFLLSNTNELHLNFIRETHGKALFKNYFDKEYYSHEVGMHKPDAQIFLKVLQENNLKPEETLFIDDSCQHIEAAAKLGLATQLVSPEKDIFTIENLLI